MASPAITETSVYLMTEPFYIFLTLTTFLSLDKYLKNRRLRWLLLTGLLSGLCLLTRYVGVSVIGTVFIIMLFYDHPSIIKRIYHQLLFLAISLPLTLVWIVYNTLETGSGTNRFLAVNSFPGDDFNLAFANILGWVKPIRGFFTLNWVNTILFAAITLLIFFVFKPDPTRPKIKQSPWVLIWLLITYLVLYSATTLFSRFFVDASITFYEQRILAPAYLCIFILGFVLFSNIYNRLASNKYLKTGLILIFTWVFLVYFSSYAASSQSILRSLSTGALGYSKEPKKPLFVKALAQIPGDAILYSNNIEHTYYLTGRTSYLIEDGVPDYFKPTEKIVIIKYVHENGFAAKLTGTYPDANCVYDDGQYIICGIHNNK
jgi:4-amino-4-deoxy-L-arabinose transferase-like glycosyltransferase